MNHDSSNLAVHQKLTGLCSRSAFQGEMGRRTAQYVHRGRYSSIAAITRKVLLLYFALVLAGCATPIGVNYVDRTVAYHSLTANVLSATAW